MSSEDDLFSKLKRPTFDELFRLIDETPFRLGDDINYFIECHDWSVPEYFTEYYRRKLRQ